MDFPDDFEMPFDLVRLIPDAVALALKDENPDKLLSWLKRNLPRYADSTQHEISPDIVDILATQFFRMIWNALPLPGNGFRPRPLPLPGRNDPCLCGSGRKYKHCCAQLPKAPSVDPLELWPLVLDNLPEPQLKQALEQRQVPAEALVATALDWFDEERYTEVVELLQPLFAGPLKKPRPGLALGLQVLCDTYDELEEEGDKELLLERIIAEAPASPLRAGAWQRLAALCLDRQDLPGARQAFENAMRDNPQDPALSYLEIQILGAEERWDHARERARFWLKRLQRSPYDPEELETLFAFLEEAAKDPRQALEELREPFEELPSNSESLLDWIEEIIERPLPNYRAVEEPVVEGQDLDAELTKRLRAMGVPKKEIPRALAMLEEQQGLPVGKGEDDSAEDTEPEEDASMVLEDPAELKALEQRWFEVAGLEKPFGTSDLGMVEWDGWDSDHANRWQVFLAQHPAAGDSLEIIDDLLTAILIHPDGPSATLLFQGVLPLARRADAIVQQALAGLTSPQLHWNRIDNRAALRSLVRLYQIVRYNLENDEECERLLTLLLALNPQDNHGLRADAMNHYLRRNRNEAAVQLAERYPGDMLAETRYGLVLALYRLNRARSARQAAESAIADLPLVARYLVRSRVRRPELSPYGMQPGGEDQAWDYREAMRDQWKAARGALAWLGKIMNLQGANR